MSRPRRAAWIAAALAASAACQSRVASFSLISTRPVPFKPPATGRGMGSDTGHQLLGTPVPFFSNPSGYPSDPWSVDKAIEITKGNVLIDAELSWSLWNVYYYGEWTSNAEGTVARLTASRPARRPAPLAE